MSTGGLPRQPHVPLPVSWIEFRMNNATPVERIRQVIAWQLGRLGVRDTQDMHETMLIHHGLFCGRKFQCEEHEVVWFLEEDEIKFFSPLGELLIASSAVACIEAYEREHPSSGRRAA